MEKLNNSHKDSQADVFECGCGDQIGLREISSHFTSCKSMKKRYSSLFQYIDKLITQKAENLQDWKNLSVLFKFLEGHIKMMIVKETKKPTKFEPQKEEPVNMGFSGKHMKADEIMDDEEEKIDSSSYMSHNKMEEEEKYGGPDLYYQESMQRCAHCNKYITPQDEQSENQVFLE
jgi:hypothetical protein